MHYDVYYQYVQIQMRERILTGVEQLKQMIRWVGCHFGNEDNKATRKCLHCSRFFRNRFLLMDHLKQLHRSKFADFLDGYQTRHARFHNLCPGSCNGECIHIDLDVHGWLFH